MSQGRILGLSRAPARWSAVSPDEQLIADVTVRLNSLGLTAISAKLHEESDLGGLLRGFLASASGDANSVDWCALEIVALCDEVSKGLVCVTCGRDKAPDEVCKAVCCDK